MRLKQLRALETLASKRDDFLSQMKGREEITVEYLKLRDICSGIATSDDSEGCTKDKLKEEEFSSLQFQVNYLKGRLKTLATALRESNKITQSTTLPSKTEEIHAVWKKYKLNPSNHWINQGIYLDMPNFRMVSYFEHIMHASRSPMVVLGI
jgi:hypothetical protein